MGQTPQESPNYKLIMPAVVLERIKIRESLARAARQELLSKELIKLVAKHRAQETPETPRVKMHEWVQ